MAREHLARRRNWQGAGVARGHGAEDVFSVIMAMHLEGTGFQAEHKPRDLESIYGVRIGKDKRERSHGIRPEYAIRNGENGKAVYVEIKRQRAAGNAHERACKYMMPGIVASACAAARQTDGAIPFWWIFTNGIASDRYYRQEIMHWFRGIEKHVLLWKNVRDRNAVINHFEQYIRPLLV